MAKTVEFEYRNYISKFFFFNIEVFSSIEVDPCLDDLAGSLGSGLVRPVSPGVIASLSEQCTGCHGLPCGE